MLAEPEWLTGSSWQQHIPFAMFLVSAHRPLGIVEVGSLTGDSYFAFCQAVKTLGLATASYAVGTDLGERRTNAIAELEAHNNQHYSEFSKLLRDSSELRQINDGSIDLLHLDRQSTYDSIRHEFEFWLSKLSRRAIVLIHHTNMDEEARGPRELWDEMRGRYNGFEFQHGEGLGILGVGETTGPELQAMFGADEAGIQQICDFFKRLGSAVNARATADDSLSEAREADWGREEDLYHRLRIAERRYRAAEERRLTIEPIAEHYEIVTSSKAWKAVELAWKLRRRIAPAGSRRARISNNGQAPCGELLEASRADDLNERSSLRMKDAAQASQCPPTRLTSIGSRVARQAIRS